MYLSITSLRMFPFTSSSSLSPLRFTNCAQNTLLSVSFLSKLAISIHVRYGFFDFWSVWILPAISINFVTSVAQLGKSACNLAISASTAFWPSALRQSSWKIRLYTQSRSCSRFCFIVALAAIWRLSAKLIYCCPSCSTILSLSSVFALSRLSSTDGAISRDINSGDVLNFIR